MITLRKLQGLSEGVRNRKLPLLLKEAEEFWKLTSPPDDQVLYWRGIAEMACSVLGQPVPDHFTSRTVWELRQRMLDLLGTSTADWDFQTPGDAHHAQKTFPLSVYLEDLRSPFNVGSILRTAEAYGFHQVLASPLTPTPAHPRVQRSSMGSLIPFRTLDLESLKCEWGNQPVLALELGGRALADFVFPREPALVLLGSEELGLSPEALSWAEQSCGRVTLPLYGRKASLNVGVAFGILASHWTNAF